MKASKFKVGDQVRYLGGTRTATVTAVMAPSGWGKDWPPTYHLISSGDPVSYYAAEASLVRVSDEEEAHGD